jgi:hypothetical protein
MAKYDAGDKPIFQTERAISGVRGGNFMGPSQAVRMLLHRDLLESVGIPTEHNAVFYVNEHGFGQCPSYVMSAAGPHPAALAMRTRRAQVAGLKFSESIDFGPTGNKVFMGLRYDGPERSVITLRNYGTTDQQLEAAVAGGQTLEEVDAFGNGSKLPVTAGKANLTIGQMPIYLRLAKGQQVALPKWDFGPNIAPAASFAYSGTYQGKFDCLTNGVMEGFHAGNPVSNVDHAPIFWGEFKQSPQMLEIKFPQPRPVSKMLIFGVRADNQYCALLDYDLQYRKGDSWVTIQEARAHCPPSNWSSVPLCIANTWYLDNNFFIHQFEPVTTDALRLVIKRTSFGLACDELASEAVFRTWGGRREPFVMIREIEAYGPPGAATEPSSHPQAATGPAGKD